MREDFYGEYFQVEDRHWWFVGRRRIILEVLSTHLPPAAGGREREILDMGCGTGTMLPYLRRFGVAQGVDADERAVEFCRRRGEDSVQLLESPELPFADSSFDLVTTLDVLEHIQNDDEALREIERVLRPQGLALITVPVHPWMWGPQDEISHHQRRYRPHELEEKITATGLEPIRLTYFNTILFPPIAVVRLVRRLLPRRGDARSDFELTGDGLANRALGALFSREAGWLRNRDLPFGVSQLALARASRP